MILSFADIMSLSFADIQTFISSVGIPTALCVYLIYVNNKNNEKHAEEIDKLRETVENNTRAMIKLCAKMGVNPDG